MQMNFSWRKKREGRTGAKLRGRTGHRLARVGDWLFVVGGVDREGAWVNEVQRISTQNHRMDQLLLDNTLCLEGFSLFSLQETLYLWGGISNRQPSHQLLLFDGCKFTPQKQTGQLPSPRGHHLSATFGGKYLIVFGGNNGQLFFKDWYLFNIKTLEWRRLLPSLEVPFASSGSMVWLAGRGLLLLNEAFDPLLRKYCENKFFQFYVNDFNRNQLTVKALNLNCPNFQNNLIFTNMAAFGDDTFLVFGGYDMDSIRDPHDLCFMVNLESQKIEEVDLSMGPLLAFESLFYKQDLYLVGGDQPAPSNYQGLSTHTLKRKEHRFKRHVCQMCRLYYDEEWSNSTRQIYSQGQPKEEMDFSFNMKIDNRVLQKFATYIRDQFYAFTLVLSCLKIIGAKEIEISLQKVKSWEIQQNFQYLKIGCCLGEGQVGNIINFLVMEQQFQVVKSKGKSKEVDHLQSTLLRFKLASYKLAKSTLLTFRTSKQEICVVYYSSSQLECPNGNFSPVPCYTYTYNTKQKTSNQHIHRSIIFQNLRNVFDSPHHYQDIGQNNLSIVSFCGDAIQSQISLLQHTAQPETGQSSLFGLGKEQYKRSVPLIQLSFLPDQELPPIFIDNNHLTFINIRELLQGDQRTGILKSIDLTALGIIPSSRIFAKIQLFNIPEEYWFKRVLVYHKGRLISHFRQGQSRICGVVELDGRVELDLGGTNLARYRDKLIVQTFLEQLKSLKRDNQL